MLIRSMVSTGVELQSFKVVKVNRLLKNIGTILVLTLTTGCSVFGIRTSEELKYNVIQEDGSFEIREYEPYISAEASLKGDYQEVQNKLFGILAGYIFGKNKTKEKISMTAPVMVDSKKSNSSEKIAMTAPVTMEGKKGGIWKMAFSMPAKYNLENLPEPADSRVELKKQPKKYLAVHRYSGNFDNLKIRQKKLAELIQWLEGKSEYQQLGEPFYAGYDPPFTLSFLRRNEIMIEIKPK